MGMCRPSGGINKAEGRIGSLPRYSEYPNSKTELYDENGELIQERWYGPDGIVIWNRDHKHTDYKQNEDLRKKVCPNFHMITFGAKTNLASQRVEEIIRKLILIIVRRR